MKTKLFEKSLFGNSGHGEMGGGGYVGQPLSKTSKQKAKQEAISKHNIINMQLWCNYDVILWKYDVINKQVWS